MHLSKPIRMQELVAAVTSILKSTARAPNRRPEVDSRSSASDHR